MSGPLVHRLWRSFPLRWHLLALVFATTIPLLIFAFIISAWLVKAEREKSEQQLLTATNDLGALLDRELNASITSLLALASVQSLKRGDLKSFHGSMSDVLPTQFNWLNVLVHDEHGKTLLSARHPYGEKLPRTLDPDSLTAVFDLDRPVIGSVYTAPPKSSVAGETLFAVRVPIRGKNDARLSLTALVSVRAVQRLLTPTAAEPKPWTRAITDGKHTVAARSRYPERFVGRRGSPDFITRTQETPSGLARMTSLEGQAVYMAFAHAPFSHWIVAIITPIEEFDASAGQVGLVVMGVGVLLLLAFGTGATAYAQRLGADIRTVAASAAGLAQGQVPALKSSFVTEVEDLQESLSQAAVLIVQRDRARVERLMQINAELEANERANRAKSEFVTNMSHELRTPLGVILGAIELLGDVNHAAEDRESLVVRMRRNAQHLLALIDQILDLSKVDAGALQIEAKAFSPQRLIDDIRDSLTPSARAKGLTLEMQIAENVSQVVVGDPVRTRQILMNVVGNAVKFTDSGRVRVSLSEIIDPANSAATLEFTIDDTGIGMTPEEQARLFRPFSQADGSIARRFGGTGLGLFVSKRLAQTMGGDIELSRSERGYGSEFRIRLKVDVPTAAHPASPWGFDDDENGGSAVSSTPQLLLRGLRVLLVDDSEDNRFLIRRFLTQAGADVVECGAGREAVELALTGDYDFVLMDIQMPGTDGNEATSELRRRGYLKPIIALTAHAMKSDRERALQSGYDGYFTKPVSRTELIEALHRGYGA